MSVLDASAVIAGLTGERGSERTLEILVDPFDRPRLASINLAECVDHLVRRGGFHPDAVLGRIELLVTGGLEVVDVDEGLAVVAGAMRARRYDRRRSPVSLADCVAIALAALDGDRLVTLDGGQATAARAEGVEVVDLGSPA